MDEALVASLAELLRLSVEVGVASAEGGRLAPVPLRPVLVPVGGAEEPVLRRLCPALIGRVGGPPRGLAEGSSGAEAEGLSGLWRYGHPLFPAIAMLLQGLLCPEQMQSSGVVVPSLGRHRWPVVVLWARNTASFLRRFCEARRKSWTNRRFIVISLVF